MFMIQGDWFADGMQSVDTQSLVDSVIITNKSIIRNIRIPTYEAYKAHWRNGEISLARINTLIDSCISALSTSVFRFRNTETLLGGVFSSTSWNNFRFRSGYSINGVVQKMSTDGHRNRRIDSWHYHYIYDATIH